MGVSRWPEHSMRGGLAETAYQRGFYKGRDSGERRAWRAAPGAQAALRASVRAALHLMYERHEEVPLLGMFRKEQLGELLAVRSSDEPARPEHERGGGSGALSAHTRRVRRWDVLYAVQEAAEQWRALARAREARAAAYRRALDAAGSDAERAALGRCVALASAAQSPEALDDAEAAFRVAAPPLEELLEAVAVGGGGAQAGAFKRPQRGAAHQLAAAAAGLEPVLEALGLAPAEFGRSVEAGFRVTEPVDADALPEAVAQALVEPSRPSRRDAPAVLRAARAAAAAALAAEPAVRRAVREAFRRHAVVSTDPTPAGDAALGPFHPLGPAKRLRAKPLRRFEGTDLFLRVLAAEAGGLVTVSLAIPEAAEVGAGAARGAAGLIASLADYGASSAPTPAAEAWNAERAGAVHDAVARRLLPALAAEARARLGAEARAVALQAASDAAWELATAAPLRVALPDEEGQFVAERRFMGACYGPGQPATTFVMLDAAGQMVDFLHCPQLSGVIPKRRAPPGMPYDMFSDPKKSADAARLRDFVEAHLPHAIVVGVAHPEARTLLEDVQGVVNQILTDNPRAFTTSEAGAALVRAADERVPAAWAACAAARAELPAAAGAVRRALALARQALDPLALLASLAAGPPAELASLPLHPLQPWLPQEARAAAVERALCSAAAQVGVDLNALAAAPWAAPTLQFVPGLGPRKAAALLGALGRAGGVLESRAQAWRELGVLGNRVFTNAAPALRVRASSRAAANLELDPLDDMRVHPESYAFAVAMAQSATGGGDAAAAVENALAAPREVVVLQLDAYDRHLRATAAAEAAEAAEEEGEDAAAAAAAAGGTRLATLLDIQAEFVAPYGELRPPGAAPSPQELFWMSLGEDEETLRPGRRLEARVRYVGDELARVVLPDLHGAEGVIRAEDVSARAPHGGQGAMAGLQQPSCREYFKQGDVVAAVVDFVDAEAGEIRLATDSARLNRDWHWEKEYLGKQGEGA
jgi:transcription elongation factor SPT6